eukprot:6941032-Prymnesium_polylepis.1
MPDVVCVFFALRLSAVAHPAHTHAERRGTRGACPHVVRGAPVRGCVVGAGACVRGSAPPPTRTAGRAA